MKEFTETPTEVENTCDRSDEATINKRWRGELSIIKHERYIEIEWKKIVQKAPCVKAMEFFVDGEKQEDVWRHNIETVRINKIEQFSLKVKVFFANQWNNRPVLRKIRELHVLCSHNSCQCS